MSRLVKKDVNLETARRMLKLADAAKVNTYPEPGKFTVTVLTDRGNIYEGVVYKSTTRTLTMHCEATALAHAAIHGETNIIAITGPNCHICKQLIWESAIKSGIDVQVVMRDGDGVKLVPISEQMPYPWPDENGDKYSDR